MRKVLLAFAFVAFVMISCSQSNGKKGRVSAAFYALSASGAWEKVGDAAIAGGGLKEGESVPTVADVKLLADASDTDFRAGDTIGFVSWNSERDGSGELFDSGSPKVGDWYAKYEVKECTVWFSANFGDGNNFAPVSTDKSRSWKVTAPDTSVVRKHFRAIWHKDETFSDEPFDFEDDIIAHSMTLYADWETPLCFTALDNGCSVKLLKNNTPAVVSLETSVDGGANWTEYVPLETGSVMISLDRGESVYFSAVDSNATFSTASLDRYRFYLGDENKKIAASGNVMSLLDGTLVLKDLFSTNYYVFFGLFENCKSLVSAPALPAETLARSCYQNMFKGCTSLETAPALPATILDEYCYNGMFENCTSIKSAPNLLAETLAKSCYGGMFRGCTSLETAPNLPAAVLPDICYQSMFSGCISLTSVSVLSVETFAELCCEGMFRDCIKIKLSETPSADYPTPYRVPSFGNGSGAANSCSYMFQGTGGTFTGAPSINTTYYLHKDNSIVSAN